MTTQPTIVINNRKIGTGEPCFVIAEVGINHNGDIEIAKKIITLAHEIGFDAVKFQKRNPDIAIPEHQKNIMRETPWGIITYLEYKKKIEFWEKEFNEIDTHCKKLGIMWFASPWDTESVDFLGKYNPPCYKIPSALLTHEEYLQHLKRTGKPIIMSTGMSTLEQIDQAVRILSDQSLAVLHCTSKYPCAMEELNLKCIDMLRKRYPHVVIGYSGHEPGVLPSVVAVAAHGATIIERHVTLNRSMWGTDHASSLERKGMENLIRDIRNLNRMQGDGQKQIYDSELPVIEKLRKN